MSGNRLIIKNDLVPSVQNIGDLEELIVSLLGKHKVSLKTMFDTDSCAFEKGDMLYFPDKYWGMVPTYASFMYMLKKSMPEKVDDIKAIEAECLGAGYESEMRDIFEKPTEDMDGMESKRFSWGEKLYKIQERKLDRIEKKKADAGVERGVDLTLKIISSLSNSQLSRVKEIMDAEWSEEIETVKAEEDNGK